MRDFATPTHIKAPVRLQRAIKKAKAIKIDRSLALDCEYPIDDIIIKCMKIQKLLERSSRAITKFSQDIRSLNREMEEFFRPLGLPVTQNVVAKEMEELGLVDHREVFDRILEYSDVSEVEEPEECNTSRCDFVSKKDRRLAAEKRRLARKMRATRAQVSGANHQVSAEAGMDETA